MTNKLKKEIAIIDNLNNKRVATLVEDETIGSHGDKQFNEWFERLVDKPKDKKGWGRSYGLNGEKE